MEDNIIRNLETWGCDISGAMHRLSGNTACFFACLDVLVDELDLDTLAAAIDRQDAKAVFSIAHYHKGSLANLGITPLLQPISAITEICRDGDSCEGVAPLLVTLREKLAEFLAIVKP